MTNTNTNTNTNTSTTAVESVFDTEDRAVENLAVVRLSTKAKIRKEKFVADLTQGDEDKVDALLTAIEFGERGRTAEKISRILSTEFTVETVDHVLDIIGTNGSSVVATRQTDKEQLGACKLHHFTTTATEFILSSISDDTDESIADAVDIDLSKDIQDIARKVRFAMIEGFTAAGVDYFGKGAKKYSNLVLRAEKYILGLDDADDMSISMFLVNVSSVSLVTGDVTEFTGFIFAPDADGVQDQMSTLKSAAKDFEPKLFAFKKAAPGYVPPVEEEVKTS